MLFRSGDIMSPVEVLRVITAKQLHSLRNRRWWHAEHEMEMVRHQAPGEHAPIEAAAHPLEKLDETPTIGVVVEDRLPSVSPAGDVADPSRLIAQRARHPSNLRPHP